MFEPDIPKSHAIAKFLAQRVFYEVFAWEPGLGLLHASCLNPAQRVFYEVFAWEPLQAAAALFRKPQLIQGKVSAWESALQMTRWRWKWVRIKIYIGDGLRQVKKSI